MAQTPIRIPKVSNAAHEAELVALIVPEGGTVAEGQPLFSVGTDKVETDIDAAATGVVRWTGSPNETYEVGAQIGHIETAD